MSDECEKSSLQPQQGEHFACWTPFFEWYQLSASIRPQTRRHAMRTLGQTLHGLWREGYELGDFPPYLWQLAIENDQPDLVIPHAYLTKRIYPHTVDQVVALLAAWYRLAVPQVRRNDCLRFLIAFVDDEPVDGHRFANLVKEITDTAKRQDVHFSAVASGET